VTSDEAEWISSDEARQLENALFPTTMRERITEIIRGEPDADYWERLVVRYAEALLATVDYHLRGIPVEEAGIEKWTV
jgi:hypothetical protein